MVRLLSVRVKSCSPISRKNVDEIITIDDNELIVAFLDMVENHKMIVENSGLLTVAALKHIKAEKKKVVSILSGGNMDVITLSSIVQHGLIQRDRVFTVSVLLPDKPGELAKGIFSFGRAAWQYYQAGAQPVYQHQPQCGCGTSDYHGGIWDRA